MIKEGCKGRLFRIYFLIVGLNRRLKKREYTKVEERESDNMYSSNLLFAEQSSRESSITPIFRDEATGTGNQSLFCSHTANK